MRVVPRKQCAPKGCRSADIGRHGGVRLGTDPSPGKGAIDWATRTVNLLNVAVSRARRRFFVIGSYAEWSGAPNFSVLA
jgi:hypothetical protein